MAHKKQYSDATNTAKQINTEFGLVIFTDLLNKTPTHTKKVRLFDSTPTSQEYFYLFQKNRLPFPHVHNYSSGETYTAITAYQKAFNLTIKDAFIALCNKYINSTFAPANTPKYTPATATQVTQVIPNNPLQVDIKDFGTSICNSHASNFVSFLNKTFPTDIVKQVIQMYNVGTRVFDSSNNDTYWNNFDTAFWYSDISNKVINAKYFIYDENNAKRSKTVNPNWYHAQKHKDKPIIGFFGEHLSINNNQTIWIVESEKSAIIVAINLLMNNITDTVVWACGGQNSLLATFAGCSVSKQELQSREIILVPDTDTHHTSFNKWLEYADRLTSEGFDVYVSEYLQNTCTNIQKELKFDIADLLISDLGTPATPATPATNDIPATPATNDIPAIPAIPATNEVTELHYKSYENLFKCFNTDNLGVLVKIYVNETKKFHKNELELFFRSFDFGLSSVEFEIFEVFDVFEELEKVTNIIKPQLRHN